LSSLRCSISRNIHISFSPHISESATKVPTRLADLRHLVQTSTNMQSDVHNTANRRYTHIHTNCHSFKWSSTVVMASMLRNCLPANSISLQYEDRGLLHTIPANIFIWYPTPQIPAKRGNVKVYT